MDVFASTSEPGRRSIRIDRSALFEDPRHIPLISPRSRSAMYFPLAVLVAVLPGLFAVLSCWDLDPPGPWWGIRAVSVALGNYRDQDPGDAGISSADELQAYRRVTLQPPLYAWLSGLALRLSPTWDPLFIVTPAYLCGAAAIFLVYVLVRTSRSDGTAFLAAALASLSPAFLGQEKVASPTNVGLCCVLASAGLFEHARRRGGGGGGRGRLLSSAAAGAALGLAALSIGWFALVALATPALQRIISRAPDRSLRSAKAKRVGVVGVLLAVTAALAVAGPWFLEAFRRHGAPLFAALAAPPDIVAPSEAMVQPGLLSRLAELAPAFSALACLGLFRSFARLVAWDDDLDPATEAFWPSWFIVAALVPAVWREAPRSLVDIYLLIPSSALAASTAADLIARREPVRSLVIFAPATALAMVWAQSADLRDAVSDLSSGRVDHGTALGLHLVLDVLLCSVLLCRRIDHWARRSDRRRRGVLATFLLLCLGFVVFSGFREAGFRHHETRELIDLRRIVLRRHSRLPFQEVIVVNRTQGKPGAPPVGAGGRLRFMLYATLPDVPIIDLASIDSLTALDPAKPMLVVLAEDQRLAYSQQSRLRLETIHSSAPELFLALASVQELRAASAAPERVAKSRR